MCWRTPNCSPLLICWPSEDERLSWPGWLTCSGRLTHISGHPSVTGQAQDGERTLVRDWRSTAEPRGPPSQCTVLCWATRSETDVLPLSHEDHPVSVPCYAEPRGQRLTFYLWATRNTQSVYRVMLSHEVRDWRSTSEPRGPPSQCTVLCWAMRSVFSCSIQENVTSELSRCYTLHCHLMMLMLLLLLVHDATLVFRRMLPAY